MALLITDECINCGACKTECPNTAIYEGGVSWALNGKLYNSIREDYYYIVHNKCTECIGFYNEPQCVAVCPVDCIIVDPEHVETKKELLIKKEKLDLTEK